MKANSITVKITTLGVNLVALILIVMPFHAFLTVWLNSIVGHYDLLRLWKEYIVVALTGVAIYLLLTDTPLRRRFLASKLNQLSVLYLLLVLLWGLIPYLTHHLTLKAFGFGIIIDGRFLLFFLVVSVFANYSPKLKENWPKLIFWPAAVVAVIGLVQYFALPYDFLRHFGYNQSTIFPYETINHNTHYIRVISTLRGANPLGAYLLMVLPLLGALWFKLRQRWMVIAGIVGVVVLVLTFSRSAWLGLVLAAVTLVWASFKTKRSHQLALATSALLIVLAGIAGLALRHNATFQNAIFHTSDHSTITTSSNEGHASALRAGLRDVIHEPLGRGTGSAGPASVYNAGKSRIAENFFVQVGQELGWLGGVVFIAIQLWVGRDLWRKRQDSLALGLLAALVGVSFVNLLSHAWSDDTLAYIFWGLAAVALTPEMVKKTAKKVR